MEILLDECSNENHLVSKCLYSKTVEKYSIVLDFDMTKLQIAQKFFIRYTNVPEIMQDNKSIILSFQFQRKIWPMGKGNQCVPIHLWPRNSDGLRVISNTCH